jgi:aminoglycoside phosphotransferase (APT) family kinase protein
MMQRTKHLRDGLRNSCLVHGDFNPSNILVRDGRIAAILDWEFAHAGTRWMDVGNLLRHCPLGLRQHVRAGLISGGASVPPDWQARAELVDLSSALEFLTGDRSDAFKGRCVERVRGTFARYGSHRPGQE